MRLGAVLKAWRWAEKLNIRTAASGMGVSAATLSRIENGELMDGETLAKILSWLTDTDKGHDHK